MKISEMLRDGSPPFFWRASVLIVLAEFRVMNHSSTLISNSHVQKETCCELLNHSQSQSSPISIISKKRFDLNHFQPLVISRPRPCRRPIGCWLVEFLLFDFCFSEGLCMRWLACLWMLVSMSLVSNSFDV